MGWIVDRTAFLHFGGHTHNNIMSYRYPLLCFNIILYRFYSVRTMRRGKPHKGEEDDNMSPSPLLDERSDVST